MGTKRQYEQVALRVIEFEEKEIDMLSMSGEGGDVEVSFDDIVFEQ